MVIMLGMNHFKNDEVDSVRDSVIKVKPDVLLHELLYDEYEYYSKRLPRTILLDLEKDIDKSKKKSTMVRHY